MHRAQGVQHSSIRTVTDITSIAEQSQGNTTVRITQSGSNASSYQTNTSSHSGSTQTVNGSHNIEKTESIQQSSVQVDADTIAQTEVISGVTAIREESSSTPTKLRPSTYSISHKSEIEVFRNYVTRKNINSNPSSFSSKNDRLSEAPLPISRSKYWEGRFTLENESAKSLRVTDLTIKNVDVNLIDKIDHELLGSGISRVTFLSMQLTIIVNQLHITQHEKRLSDRLELDSQCLKTVMNASTETTKMLERILREIKKLQ